MNNIFKGFALAVSMMTSIPFFKVHNFNKGINGYAVMSYPLVGLLLGSILWGVHSLLEPSLPSMHLGIIIFVFWVILTGALHLEYYLDQEGFDVSGWMFDNGYMATNYFLADVTLAM